MMSRSAHIWKRLVFKSLFSVFGLILFTAQVSYKFYKSASMPEFRPSVERHAVSGAVSGSDAGATLNLDKRFDVKPSFALLTPVFCIIHVSGVAIILPFLAAPNPVDNDPAFTPLRGPPSAISLS